MLGWVRESMDGYVDGGWIDSWWVGGCIDG